jgi:WD40 repeat protein
VQVWDVKTGSTHLIYRGHGNNNVSAVAWSPDGQEIASGDWDHKVLIWVAS